MKGTKSVRLVAAVLSNRNKINVNRSTEITVARWRFPVARLAHGLSIFVIAFARVSWAARISIGGDLNLNLIFFHPGERTNMVGDDWFKHSLNECCRRTGPAGRSAVYIRVIIKRHASAALATAGILSFPRIRTQYDYSVTSLTVLYQSWRGDGKAISSSAGDFINHRSFARSIRGVAISWRAEILPPSSHSFFLWIFPVKREGDRWREQGKNDRSDYSPYEKLLGIDPEIREMFYASKETRDARVAGTVWNIFRIFRIHFFTLNSLHEIPL